MVSPEYDIQNELRNWLKDAERVVVAGIGNPIRMDDFVGVKIVQDLKGKVSQRVYLIECETVPEGYTQQIIDFNPTHILLVDAAILGLRPGQSKLAYLAELETFPAFSTHILPIRVFCEHLARATKAKIALLLIEPKMADFGEGLTPEVTASVEKLENTLSEVLP